MNTKKILSTIEELILYLEKKKFKGYDPYDALNIPLPWEKLPRWGPIMFIQLFKRFPFNLRNVLGIKREYNPKAMGLFLLAFTRLNIKTGKKEYLDKADFFFNWLYNNRSQTYSGSSWGYNFFWISPIRFLKPYTPSSVVTGFICRAIFEYYKLTGNELAKKCLLGASEFITNHIPVYKDQSGLSYSYTPVQEEICYNASLLAAEILAYSYIIDPNDEIRDKILKACNFVISRQNEDGSWYYSEKIKTGERRKQIDFHQGFVLDTLLIIQDLLKMNKKPFDDAIIKGLEFYRNYQFFENGRSKFRLPKNYPADIHHQAQGIITFSRFKDYGKDNSTFALEIADWTIKNMKSVKGYFYYRKGSLMSNKIEYIRWGQAWMLLALTEVL
ncbi:MAG: hypothetical protein JW894_02585 [Bacteroidales bacterium]|nr:hypothetical protein [Bacteroidales bacterium]